MNRSVVLLAAAALAVGGLLSGCASTPSAPEKPPEKPPAKTAEPEGPCRATLGVEAAAITRAVRARLSLPAALGGALVTEVLAGGPGAAAGLRPGDVIQSIGDTGLANECEFIDQAFGRTCATVAVTLRRDGQTIEKDVKPVSELPFYEKRCAENVPTACFRTGWLLWARNRTGDRERALDVYRQACASRSAEACAYGGLHLADTEKPEAVEMLERGCEFGSGAGCAHLAFLYAVGRIVPRDDAKATPLYEKGCELGDARSCYNVGLMAEDGRGMPRDLARAIAAYEEACDTGSSTACTNLGHHYEKGTGVEKDPERAFALYQKGCEGTSCQPRNLAGCVNVGRAYRDGIGVERDPAEAAAIFDDACSRETDPDDVHAEENRSRACSLLGALLLNGDGVEQDLEAGRELSELGCEHGDAFGCFNAAAVYAGGTGVERNPARAAQFLQKACDGGDGEGCHLLAAAYAKGNGVPRDRRRAAEIRRRGCELGFEPACGPSTR